MKKLWQPIETLELKSGVRVLGYMPNFYLGPKLEGCVQIIKWVGGQWVVSWDNKTIAADEYPTHWMPIEIPDGLTDFAMPTVKQGFLCSTAWEEEMGHNPKGTKVFPNEKEARERNLGCLTAPTSVACTLVEVEVRCVRYIKTP